MGTYGGPHIIQDGLIFAIDAGNPECFTSGGTTATDLIQGFNCSGASGTPGTGIHTPNTANFPVYNSTKGGVFDFAGGKGINIDGNLGSTSSSSLSMWLYRTPGSTDYITDGRNNGGSWFLSNYVSFNLTWHQTLRYNFEDPYNANASAFINKWIHIVAASDSTGSKLYVNGVYKAATGETSADEDFGINYRIGTRYTTGSEWTGYMGPIYFYNKKLNAAEAAQNFLAQKSRFGL
ncbi:LamG domain-containing protein [bacterium]|nr:LamG domain-containing protein [bacterium]